MSFKQTRISFKQTGEYFGYPKCCIDSFSKVPFNKRTLSQLNVHKYTGFIPCDQCATKIMSNEITLENLIKNRICIVPFPNGGGKNINYI